jgi:hypothetical protein
MPGPNYSLSPIPSILSRMHSFHHAFSLRSILSLHLHVTVPPQHEPVRRRRQQLLLRVTRQSSVRVTRQSESRVSRQSESRAIVSTSVRATRQCESCVSPSHPSVVSPRHPSVRVTHQSESRVSPSHASVRVTRHSKSRVSIPPIAVAARTATQAVTSHIPHAHARLLRVDPPECTAVG